jgi:hypothetical protein
MSGRPAGDNTRQTALSSAVDRPPIRWSGHFLIALDPQPFARSLLKTYGPVAILVYCAVIALAFWLRWPWLTWWLNFWTPIADSLQKIIPVFDNVESTLLTKGLSDRVPVVLHVIAFGWLINTPIFLFLVVTILRLPREHWIRFAAITPAPWRALVLIGGTVFFVFALCWTVFGFGLEDPIFGMQNVWALIVIGATFWSVILFGVGALIAFRSLCADETLREHAPPTE